MDRGCRRLWRGNSSSSNGTCQRVQGMCKVGETARCPALVCCALRWRQWRAPARPRQPARRPSAVHLEGQPAHSEAASARHIRAFPSDTGGGIYRLRLNSKRAEWVRREPGMIHGAGAQQGRHTGPACSARTCIQLDFRLPRLAAATTPIMFSAGAAIVADAAPPAAFHRARAATAPPAFTSAATAAAAAEVVRGRCRSPSPPMSSSSSSSDDDADTAPASATGSISDRPARATAPARGASFSERSSVTRDRGRVGRA